MFSNFTEEARKILVTAKIEMIDLKHPYVGSEHLLLAILKFNNSVSEKLKEYDLDYDKLKKEIIQIIGVGKEESHWTLYTPILKRILETAIMDSKENNNGDVTVEHLFSSLLEEGEGVAIRIMLGLNIDLDSLYQEFVYKIATNKRHKKGKKLLIDELGIDLTKKAIENNIDPVVGREKEVKRVLEILSRRTKNNPLLIGEAGVGKTAIVEELSRLIVTKQVPLSLQNKRIISLDMATSVAGTKYRGEFEDRMKKLLKEMEENDDIILFIDEIHTLVGAGGAEGAIDASNIFKPALARNKIRCIGATTTMEYKKYIEKDAALERRFQTIMIEQPDIKTVKDILYKLRPIYEKYHFVKINDEMIDLIANLSNKYIYNRQEPDRSIDILDEVCASVSLKENKEVKEYNHLQEDLEKIKKEKNEAILNNQFKIASSFKEKENEVLNKINEMELLVHQKAAKIVTKEDIANTISNRTNIPVYEILNESEKVIKEIERQLKQEIVGQKTAIEEVMKVIKKIKLGYQRQCYSMLFMGPSGVGKTALAKLVAENLVGKENVIKLDMSEYVNDTAINKMIGAAPGYVGYEDYKNIFETIKNKPYSVLILDEIEKAHPNVINLFLQILEDGKIKDNNSNTIRFDNVTIIMTSNIGFDDISVGFCQKKENEILSKLKDYFSISFINRIDKTIIFNHLTEKEMKDLINKKINKLSKKYEKIPISISNEMKQNILKKSNYKEFGARKLNKLMKDLVEDKMIDQILNDKVSYI